MPIREKCGLIIKGYYMIRLFISAQLKNKLYAYVDEENEFNI